jgi:DNA mismatch repair protein MutL
VRELRAPTLAVIKSAPPMLDEEREFVSASSPGTETRPLTPLPGLFFGTAALTPWPTAVAEQPAPVASAIPSYAVRTAANREDGQFHFEELRYIGQALECYLLCEYRDELVVVDMHAAHERVNYNRVRQALQSRAGLASQALLVPTVVVLSPDQVITILELSEHLDRMGLQIREHGERTVAVTGVPLVIAHLNVQALIAEIATNELASAAKESVEKFVDHMAARVACHASIRSGDTVSREEVYALFAALDDTVLSTACPHGRPVVVSFGRAAVERWFGRDK